MWNVSGLHGTSSIRRITSSRIWTFQPCMRGCVVNLWPVTGPDWVRNSDTTACVCLMCSNKITHIKNVLQHALQHMCTWETHQILYILDVLTYLTVCTEPFLVLCDIVWVHVCHVWSATYCRLHQPHLNRLHTRALHRSATSPGRTVRSYRKSLWWHTSSLLWRQGRHGAWRSWKKVHDCNCNLQRLIRKVCVIVGAVGG